ncbi:FAD-dependent oxidoreductase [Slackia heliotrinireducens]|uniref:FAD-dependent oxidoreductase n=1 Tax=Slackia heliotrinireducens TaxID=84110 RepID=UPI003315B7B2
MGTFEMNRRKFVAGSAVAALAAMGLASCAPSGNAESAQDEAPSAPAVELDPNAEEVDVVVVGAGISGLAACVQAAENGNSVIVLEKGGAAGGNGVGTEGIFAVNSSFQQEQGIQINPSDIVHTELSESQWRSSGALWLDLVSKSADNVAWLQEKGVGFSGVVDNYHVGLFNTMHWWKDNVGAVGYVPPMQAAAEGYGVEFRFNSPAKQLVMADGAITGVVVEGPEGEYQIKAKAVILASGGIGANPEYLKETGWTQEKVDEMMVVCSPSVEGDGYRMAREVGVKSFLANAAIQSFQGVRAFGNDDTVPYNSPLNGGNGLVALGGALWVDQDAHRFCDESIAMVFNMAANATACLGNKENYAIFDQAYIDALGLDDHDQEILDAAVAGSDPESVFSAGSVAELADHFGLDADVLQATVDRYNELVAAGADTDLGKDAAFLAPIAKAPFYIAKIVNNIVVVDGGITTNIRAEALDEDMNPIPGLYAVGLDGAMLWRNVYTQNMPGTAVGNNVNSGRNAANAARDYIAGL